MKTYLIVVAIQTPDSWTDQTAHALGLFTLNHLQKDAQIGDLPMDAISIPLKSAEKPVNALLRVRKMLGGL